jgi:hypothetical protein
MKTKDLVYIGIIAYFGYLLLKPKSQKTNAITNGINSSGLNLGANMDLPNLTPTPPNSLPTEVILNNGNIKPIIKDDIDPSLIYPAPTGASLISPNPIEALAPISTIASDIASGIASAELTAQPTAISANNPIIGNYTLIDLQETQTPVFSKNTASGVSKIADPNFSIS